MTDRSLEVLAGLSTLDSIELEHTVHSPIWGSRRWRCGLPGTPFSCAQGE
jgi:hypothetical protein